jgi:hypothetical protein
MRTSQDYGTQGDYVPTTGYDDSGVGVGWVAFAAIMLGLAGIWNTIDGILAIASSRVFVGNEVFVFSDLNTWGWIILILGVLQVIAAMSLLGGSEWARWFGIGAAGLNAIGQLFFIPIHPWWGIAMFAVDVLIIYALAVYGGNRLRAFSL